VRRSVAFALVITTLGSCNDYGAPAAAYKNWKDRLVVAAGLRGLFWPCYVKEEATKDVVAYGRIPLDQCFKMDPPRRWQGVWRNEFEGSRFCPAPAKKCSYYSPGDRIWLDAQKRPDETLYAVDFVGRRTAVKGRYGHIGGSDYELIVDRMISIRQV
jgi:hypothetical protein